MRKSIFSQRGHHKNFRMAQQTVYALSNSSMETYPNNTRSKFSNKLSKEIRVTDSNHKTLLMSLDSITFENSILQCKSDNRPDLIYIPSNTISFTLPDIIFNTLKDWIEYLRLKLVGKLLNDISWKDEVCTIITNDAKTLISPRLFHFLGFKHKVKTLSRFLGFKARPTDKIPKQITLPEEMYENKLYYRISEYAYIRSESKMNINIYTPKMIKVLSSNIEPYLSGGRFQNVLAAIPVTETNNTTMFTPSIPKFFKVNSSTLTTISVEMVDQDDIPIHFAAGPPNILKMNLKEIDSPYQNFFIHASNVDSIDIFADNTPSSFKSKLPKEINLTSRWNVAISNIFIPPKIHNIFSSMCEMEIEVPILDKPIDNDDHSPLQRVKSTTHLPSCHCESTSSLVKLLNISLHGSTLQFYIRSDGKLYVSGKKEEKFHRGQNEKSYLLRMSKKLAGLLGTTHESLTNDNSDTVDFLLLYSPSEKRFMYEFDNTPNLNFAIPPWVFLYCSAVSPTIVGHISIPLLKIIPIEHRYLHTGHFYDFQALEFFPAQTSCIQMLQFDLIFHDGKHIQFDQGSVQITLSFCKA